MVAEPALAEEQRRSGDGDADPGEPRAVADLSSVAQSGYFLLGLAALGRSDLAVASLVVFAAAYAAMNLGAFALVPHVGRDVEDLTGLGRTAAWLGAARAAFLLSSVDIPRSEGSPASCCCSEARSMRGSPGWPWSES